MFIGNLDLPSGIFIDVTGETARQIGEDRRRLFPRGAVTLLGDSDDAAIVSSTIGLSRQSA